MLEFLKSFIDKIGFVVDLIVSLPATFSTIFEVMSFPFLLFFGEELGYIVFSLFVTLITFFMIYSIVKLVLSIL